MKIYFIKLFTRLSQTQIKFIFKHRQCDIIIFDEHHSELLSKYILRGFPFYIFKQRPEILELDFMSIVRIILNFFTLLYKKNCNIQSLGTLVRSEIINSINPKILITMIDNRKALNSISIGMPKVVFIQIQNALRTNWELKISNLKPIYYYTLGNDTLRKIKNISPNQMTFKYKLAGSLMLSIAKSLNSFDSIKQKYDILYVSQLSDVIITDNVQNIFFYPQLKLIKFFSEYVKQFCQDKKVGILLRTNSDLENEFFASYFKKDDIINRDLSVPLISYSYLNSSSLVIGWFSTLLFEAAAIGKKILRIDYSDNINDFNDYENFVLFNPSKDELFKKINETLTMTNHEYFKIYGNLINEIVEPKNTHDLIHSDIACYLKNNKFNDDWQYS
jgi:surface carbohydrate biosynthesis protein